MYHIKNDERCRKSADAITNACETLMEKNLITDISISELCKLANVGRATFYRLFDRTEDVITYIIDRNLKEIIAKYEELSIESFVRYSLEAIINKENVLNSILFSGQSFLIEESLRRNIREAFNIEKREAALAAEYGVALFSGACISLLIVWNEHGRRESVNDLLNMVLKYLDLDSLSSVVDGVS